MKWEEMKATYSFVSFSIFFLTQNLTLLSSLILPSVMLQKSKVVATQLWILHPLHKPAFKIDVTSLYIKTLAIKKRRRNNSTQFTNLEFQLASRSHFIFCNTIKRTKEKVECAAVKVITAWSVNGGQTPDLLVSELHVTMTLSFFLQLYFFTPTPPKKKKNIKPADFIMIIKNITAHACKKDPWQ